MNLKRRSTHNVHFVLDEAASLGHLEAIDDAVDKYRGYGVRLQFYFQSLGQLQKCFPDGQEQTLLSNATQIFFGVNDNTTAEYVSNRLGDQTIIVESGGTNEGTSRQSGSGQGSTSYSSGSSSNWQPQARKLLQPSEVMNLSPRIAITFTPGLRPICTHLLRYYEEPAFFQSPGRVTRFFRTSGWFVRALVSLLTALMLATAVTVEFHKKKTPPHERDSLPAANTTVDRTR